MKSTRRLLWLSALLLTAAAVLGYRLWSAHAFRSTLLAARAHLERGDPASSIFVLRPALERGRQDGELLTLAARSYRLLGSPERSLQLLAAAGERGYESAETDEERALTLFELGRFSEAEPLLRASPSKMSMRALTSLHLQLFRMDQVLNDLDAWTTLDPTDPVPFVVRGDVWVQAPDYGKAAEAFRRALELDADSFEARVKLASSLRQLGSLDEAVSLLRRCIEDEPNDPAATILLAQCESELGEVISARSLLKGLLEDEPNLPVALVELGKIELDDGNFEQAERLLDRAVTLEPQNDSALYNLATALKRLSRADEAAVPLARWSEIQESRNRLRAIMDRIEADPTDVAAHVEAGTVCMDLGDLQKAARHITAALAADPEHAGARAALDRWKEQTPDNIDAPGTPTQEIRP